MTAPTPAAWLPPRPEFEPPFTDEERTAVLWWYEALHAAIDPMPEIGLVAGMSAALTWHAARAECERLHPPRPLDPPAAAPVRPVQLDLFAHA